jgi:hypothetical protein
MNYQLHWTHENGLYIGPPLSYDLTSHKYFIRQSLELGFFLVRDNAISALRGRFLKTLDQEIVDIMFTTSLNK